MTRPAKRLPVFKPLVVLEPDLIARCRDYGRAAYFAGGLKFRRDRQDPGLTAEDRMAECAFARWAGIPIGVLNWTAPPEGFVEWHSSRVMISSVPVGNRYLTWPNPIRAELMLAPFELIVHVKKAPPRFELQGFVSKQEFIRRHGTAGPRHWLDEGTWFLPEDQLNGMRELGRVAA